MAETTAANVVHKDSEVIVNVMQDFSAAYVTMYEAKGNGRPLSFEMIMDELAKKAVRHNVSTDLIRQALEKKVFERELLVARSDAPVDGTDGTISYKYSKDNTLAPVEDEKGFVDYKSLGLIHNIREGELIAEIILPTSGTDGKDIRGVPIKAMPGRAAPYNVGAQTKLSEDGTRITAACDGHVCWKNGAFCVESIVTINGDVDASVGNLDFIGDIIVKGEVMEGFKLSSAKNITIMGNATAADIQAGGNVTIKKGAINSSIVSHGDVSCQFCEHTKIHTDGNVVAQTSVICDIYCGGDLSIKALNGGKYTCLGDIEAQTIGTKNYAPTEIVAGDNAVLKKDRDAYEKRIAELDSLNGRLNQILEFLAEKKKQFGSIPADKVELLRQSAATLMANQEEKKQITEKIAEIDEALSMKQNKNIRCKGMVYPGTRVVISDSVLKVETEMARVSIRLDDSGNVVTAPL